MTNYVDRLSHYYMLMYVVGKAYLSDTEKACKYMYCNDSWIKYVYWVKATTLCLLIHVADSQSLPVVIIIFAHVSVRPSIRPSVRPVQNKQNLSENSDPYWKDCGSGRVDYWWHASIVFYYFWFLCKCEYIGP